MVSADLLQWSEYWFDKLASFVCACYWAILPAFWRVAVVLATAAFLLEAKAACSCSASTASRFSCPNVVIPLFLYCLIDSSSLREMTFSNYLLMIGIFDVIFTRAACTLSLFLREYCRLGSGLPFTTLPVFFSNLMDLRDPDFLLDRIDGLFLGSLFLKNQAWEFLKSGCTC